MQVPIFAKQHDADLALVDVEGDAEQIAGKADQLLEAHAGESGHLGDAGSDAGDGAHFPQRQPRGEGLARSAYRIERVVEHILQAFAALGHWRAALSLGSFGLDLDLALAFAATFALAAGVPAGLDSVVG